MASRNPAFRYDNFIVRISTCGPTTLQLDPPPVCIPPTCSNWSVCERPPMMTMAVVGFDPEKDDPREVRALIEQLHRLQLEIEVVVKESRDNPAAATTALLRGEGQV